MPGPSRAAGYPAPPIAGESQILAPLMPLIPEIAQASAGGGCF